MALEEAPHFMVHVGGTESNVAVTLSRLGTTAGWISRLVDNPLGRRICSEIRAQGVDVSRVLWTSGDRVGTYFVEIGSSPRPSRVTYDRAGSAMAMINPDQVDWPYVREARVMHITGITPSLSPSCRALVARALAEAASGGVTISFDVNYRAKLWSAAEAAGTLAPFLTQVQILVCTASDALALFNIQGDVGSVAEGLRGRFHPEVAVVTDGIQFAAAHDGGTITREGYRVDTVDRIGAGDAFAAGFIHGFLASGIEQGLEYGAALAALKHTFYGDIAWVAEEDIRTLISGHGVWR
jgi:2-dehydro-3-deoxygluconokinase